MIHPFAGILPANSKNSSTENQAPPPTQDSEQESTCSGWSRRAVLGWLSSAAVAPWFIGHTLSAADKEGEKKEAAAHSLHYVIPKNGKKISPATLKKLDISGGPAQGWPGRQQLAKTPGYWAWIDDDAAEKIRQEEGIESVEKFSTLDIQESGAQGQFGGQRLMVQLAPNGWGTKPKKGSFISTNDLARQWTKDVADPKVMFRPAGLASIMVMSNGPMPEAALSKIKDSPQVVAIQWAGAAAQATTRALTEEGNQPTQAQQEQGGGAITTHELHEEGGQATTRAVGEEGGRGPNQVTTQVLGEEGGR
ncbi:MAG: hypothetical protein K8T91_21865 [Planctomycetes bacterium]|nr:hypothetical protein [Planctomycetota bacterium]